MEYTNSKNDLIEYKYLICNRNCQIKFDEKLKEQFLNFLTMITINLLYCCEKAFILMNIWMIAKKFNDTLEETLEDFYSYLNMENITDADYAHANRVCKDVELKN